MLIFKFVIFGLKFSRQEKTFNSIVIVSNKKTAKSGVNSKRKFKQHKNDLITVLKRIEIVKPKQAQTKNS